MRTFYSVLFVAVVLVGCGSPTENHAKRQAVVSVLRNYRDAVNTDDAQTAVALISTPSFARFEEFKQWALHDSAEELRQRSIYEQIHVLSLRYHLRDQLADLNGKEIVSALIEKGAMKTKLLENARLGTSLFNDEKQLAYVLLYDQDMPTKTRITCLEEPDGWKVHLPGMEGVEANAYAAIMENQDLTAEQLVNKIVNDWSSETDAQQLWQPLDSHG